MSERTRVALLGAGAISQQAHLPVLSKMRGVELVALCDNDGVKARALAERFGIPNVSTDIDDLLEMEELDAVVVATPNHLHEPHVLSVLARKVNVLCERPIALTSRGVERILAAAIRADRQVAVANNHRFRSDVQALESFLHGGELGRVLAIRAGSYHADRPDGWRARRAEAGGGVFLEHGLPLLDLALWLADFPAPERVTAHMDRTRGGGSAVEDGMFVHLECANALSCSLDVSWSYVGEEDRWWFEVLATRGSARLSPLRVVKLLNGRATDVSPTGAAARESVFLQSYRAELAHFIATLRGEAKYEAPADQAVVLRVLEGIYRSADDGKEIKL